MCPKNRSFCLGRPSDRYEDVSMFGLSIYSRLHSHQQSRLECFEFRCNGAWDSIYPGQGLVILMQPCGNSSQQLAEMFPPMNFAFAAPMF